jgi:hypothetical protein
VIIKLLNINFIMMVYDLCISITLFVYNINIMNFSTCIVIFHASTSILLTVHVH